MTEAQARALERDGPRFLLGLPEAPCTPATIFGRHAPCGLEIGCGNGETLLRLATARPDQDWLGFEVHRPGVGALLQRLSAAGLGNVRVALADAAETLPGLLLPASLSMACIFFPDPWPKKRHHKRRLIQPAFLRALHGLLRPEARLFLATDWDDYREHMVEVLEAADSGFRNLAGPGADAPRPAWRPLTRFERRGIALGHQVHDLVYAPVHPAPP